MQVISDLMNRDGVKISSSLFFITMAFNFICSLRDVQ